MRRTVFNEDHEAFRQTIRDFIAGRSSPSTTEWERAGHAPRDFYNKLGELGVFGIEVPEEYGGAGETSFKFQADHHRGVRPGRASPSAAPACTGAVPALPAQATATEEQKQRWLPAVRRPAT